MRASRRVALLPAVAAVAAVAGLAGCGSSGSAKPPAPGHASPAAAAVGFLQAATANKGPGACSYVVPAQASVCAAAFSSGTSTISVQNLHVGATTTSGDRALVTALGTLCTTSSGKVCFDSTDRTAGQPATRDSFDEAYSAVESGSSQNNDPAIPCTQVNGLWYVDLGEGSAGSTPSTTISGPTPSTSLAPTVPSTTAPSTTGTTTSRSSTTTGPPG
jgi:hypothetical protein